MKSAKKVARVVSKNYDLAPKAFDEACREISEDLLECEKLVAQILEGRRSWPFVRKKISAWERRSIYRLKQAGASGMPMRSWNV